MQSFEVYQRNFSKTNAYVENSRIADTTNRQTNID
jgi:hypothetical protein